MVFKTFYIVFMISHVIGIIFDDNYKRSFISFINALAVIAAVFAQIILGNN